MANRVLRDWTASEAIDALTEGGEVFFTRLIMKADDFGCYYGNPKLLNSALFPLRNYTLDKVIKWRTECVKAGILIIYSADGKEYIKIKNFGQRLRIMQSKFPQPDDSNVLTPDSGLLTPDNIQPPETKRNEDEVETEMKLQVCVWPTFNDFWDRYDKKRGKPKAQELWEKINQMAREKIMSHLDLYCMTDKQYRKDPERYLKNESWNDEVILKDNGHTKTGKQSTEELATAFALRVQQDAASKQFSGGG